MAVAIARCRTADSAAAPASPKVPQPRPRRDEIEGETDVRNHLRLLPPGWRPRTPGRGPKLSKTERSDEYIIERIKNGKPGAMPAYRLRCSVTARSWPSWPISGGSMTDMGIKQRRGCRRVAPNVSRHRFLRAAMGFAGLVLGIERPRQARSAGKHHRARDADALRQSERAAVRQQERADPGISDRTRRETGRAARRQVDARSG